MGHCLDLIERFRHRDGITRVAPDDPGAPLRDGVGQGQDRHRVARVEQPRDHGTSHAPVTTSDQDARQRHTVRPPMTSWSDDENSWLKRVAAPSVEVSTTRGARSWRSHAEIR